MSAETTNNRLEDLRRLVTEDDGLAVHDHEQQFIERVFNLPANPFPPSGIADSAGDSPPLTDDALNFIITFLERTFKTRQRDFLVIRGDYGTGKTHTLRYIENVVHTYMNKEDRGARAVYIERPRVEAQELNRTILRTLGFDTVRKYLWFVLKEALEFEIKLPSNELKDIQSEIVARTRKPRRSKAPEFTSPLIEESGLLDMSGFNDLFGAQIMQDYRTFVQTVLKNNWEDLLQPYLVNLLIKSVGYENETHLGQLFVALLFAKSEAAFTSWETLLGISNPKMTSVLKAPTFLQFLLSLMSKNGISYVYLLVDEFEEVPQGQLLTARQRQDYLYTLREVLNKIQFGLSVILGVSPAGWDAIGSLSTPLTDVNQKVLDLPPMNVAVLRKLIEHYFIKVRMSTKYSNELGLSPFDDELLRKIIDGLPRGVQPTPRNLIQFLHSLIEVVNAREITKLSDDVLMEVMLAYGNLKSLGGNTSRARRS